MAGRVDPDPADDQRAVKLSLGARHPAQQRPQPCVQLGHPERLRHVVVGAEVEGSDLLLLATTCREDQDRDGGLAPDVPDDLQAVHVGQAQVEKDEIRPPRVPSRDRGRAVRREVHVVPVGLQVPRHQAPGVRVVLHEHDAQPRAVAAGVAHRATPSGDGTVVGATAA